METKYKKLIFSFGIILLLIIPLINAFGVTTHYWLEDNPLIINPGETIETDVVLQNMVGDEDIILLGEIIGGSEIATIIDQNTEYLVPIGSKNIKVNIKITIPENTPLRSKYDVTIQFKQIQEKEGQMVQMAGAVTTSIPVLVGVHEEEEIIETVSKSPILTTANLIISAIIIVILIIIYVVFKRNKGKQKKIIK